MLDVKNRTIFCKDNLEVLKGINSNSIDLIYLDPPFNKKKEFTAPIGSSAEGASFKDWFREEDIKDEWLQTIKEDYDGLYTFLESVKNLSSIESSKNNKHYLYNYCYLSYMAIRLIETHRILKNTGSIYLHCDNTMGHYIKILMDIIFGEKNFKNSIIWGYSNSGRSKKNFSKKHDIIYFYSKSDHYQFDYRLSVSQKYLDSHYTQKDDKGRQCRIRVDFGKKRIYYPEKGMTCNDWWQDIASINSMSKERTGYPTQKPLTLLERIIKASSNEGDVVLDPFCGCATTCIASEKLNRKWIGIDISAEAFTLVKNRLNKEVDGKFDFQSKNSNSIEVHRLTDAPKRTDKNRGDDRLQKYVYVISHPQYKGYYKVGITNNYKNRLNSYQTSDPNKAYKMEYFYVTPHFRKTEKYIHEKFYNQFEWIKGKLEDIKKEIMNYRIKE